MTSKEATIEPASTTEKEGQTKRHPATAQADPLRGGNFAPQEEPHP